MRGIVLSVFLVCSLFPPLFCEKKEEKPDIEEKVEVIGKVPLYRALQSVSVLDEGHIHDFLPEGLKGLLNQSPGMLVLNAGNPSQFAYSFARGASVNQMLYLVDGVKLHDPSSSLAGNFTFLSPQLIEKVEVVRGPLSNLYGSSAMGGVVNIITRKKEGLLLSLSAGSHGTAEGGVQFGKRRGAFSFFLTSDFLNYNDALANDRFGRRGIAVHGGYERDDLSLGLSFFGTLVDAGIPWNLGKSTPQRRYTQNNFIVSLPVIWRISGKSQLDIKASLHWNQYDFLDPGDLWNFSFANDSLVSEWQAKFSTRLLAKLNLVAGVDYSSQKIENMNNDEPQISGQKTAAASFYADLQADLDKILLAGSLRFDKYVGLPGVLSPQLGVSFNVNPTIKLRSSFSRSFRAPTLPEMLNPYWGNPGLLPETGKSIEAGADFFFASLVCGITFFDSSYKNLIGFSPLTAKFANINKADISGAEVNGDWKIFKALDWRIAYTYLHTQDIQYERALLRRPRHALTTSFLYRNAKFTLAAEMTHVGKRLDYDELLWTVAENSSFSHYDFSLTVPVQKRISVFCRVSNAFNSHFEEVLGYPAPLRRVLLGFQFQVVD
jgi:vitamin B12 transporter